MKLDCEKIDPKIRKKIDSYLELDPDNKVYVFELSQILPAENLKKFYNILSDANIHAIFTVKGMISNIYCLERDNNDSRASIK